MTLIVALIMLVLITLLVLTGLNLNKGSLQTVGNMQHRNEAYAAANETLEKVISSTRFTETPADALGTNCNGIANSNCVDVNGDGTTDITVRLTPAPGCVAVRSIKVSDLVISQTDTEDLGCSVGTTQTFGNEGSVTGNSLCSDTIWELNAEATDEVSQAKVNIVQGVSVRVRNDVISTSCP